jgi:hypothetical protein
LGVTSQIPPKRLDIQSLRGLKNPKGEQHLTKASLKTREFFPHIFG